MPTFYNYVEKTSPPTTIISTTVTVTSITNSLLGAAALTASTIVTSVGNNDDGAWFLTLPWNITYNGTSYGAVYVGTNSYITFGGSSTTVSPSATNPATNKIFISAADNSCQRIYYGTEGTSPNRTYRIRFEGTAATGGTLGSPTMVWEAVFYEAIPSQIDIQCGANLRSPSGTSGVYSSSALLASLIGVVNQGNRINQSSSTITIQSNQGRVYSFDDVFVPADAFRQGNLFTWGRNNSGALGDNTTTQRNIPVTTFAGGANWKQVAGGGIHTAAIKTDGTLWTWGNNAYGQLGNNTTTNRSTPVTTFAGGNNWKQVAGGNNHTAAIKTDGTLWTWGNNFNAQLGDNTTTNRSTPVTTFAGGNNWKQVAGGGYHTAAIKTDGTLWTWGSNNSVQLGDNTTIDRSTPVTTFAGGTNWKQVAGGGIHTVALTYIDSYQ
jgi:hypothetical protein